MNPESGMKRQKEIAPEPLGKLALLPDSTEKIAQLDTIKIIGFMNDFDLAGMETRVDAPEVKAKWDEAYKRYKLLEEELNRRIESFKIPDEIMETARRYSAALPKEQSMEKHTRMVGEYKKLCEADPLYIIAMDLASLELPINSNNKDEMGQKIKRKIRRYLEGKEILS